VIVGASQIKWFTGETDVPSSLGGILPAMVGAALSFKTWVMLLMCLCVDDVCFYTYHRMLHHPTLFKRFHKPHHTFAVPFCWSSHALHPMEIMLQSVGALCGPLLFGLSLPSLWLWLSIRQLQGVMDHVGYELPFDPLHRIYGVGGTRFHDDHHQFFNGNYASCFSIIDDVMGTRCKQSSNVK
jgi:methylsterol monooxygenase